MSPLASSEIAEAADANLVAHASYPARALPGSRVVESPSLSVIDSGIPNDTFKR